MSRLASLARKNKQTSWTGFQHVCMKKSHIGLSLVNSAEFANYNYECRRGHISGLNRCWLRSYMAKRHNKSKKFFGCPKQYSKCDIWNIDLRNPKYFIFLTCNHIANKFWYLKRFHLKSKTNFQIHLLDIWKACWICYGVMAYNY